MPIIKSAKKRVRTAQRAALRNSRSKRSLSRALKAFQRSISSGKAMPAEVQRRAQSELDKAYKKKLMSRNKVARKQRKLAQAAKANAHPVKSATTKKRVATKPIIKKPATKKLSAKK
ncbi:MAG TPA: 30S ribosomal protein S20 [Candidatus Saccharimonadales bacterium]|jgi:small subunit ribosomal protein S20|nr:30S ribosomal protein S20 [Candidatus Saccharimonadales bacterium]